MSSEQDGWETMYQSAPVTARLITYVEADRCAPGNCVVECSTLGPCQAGHCEHAVRRWSLKR